MVKISTITILGVLIALIPFSGLPFEWKNYLYIGFGLIIAVLSYLIRMELHEVLRRLHNREIKTDTFSENKPE